MARQILRWCKTRHTQYVFIVGDGRYPGKMLACVYNAETKETTAVGTFPVMTSRRDISWLCGRLDKALELYSDFGAFKGNYEMMLGTASETIKDRTLDLTPPGSNWDMRDEAQAPQPPMVVELPRNPAKNRWAGATKPKIVTGNARTAKPTAKPATSPRPTKPRSRFL